MLPTKHMRINGKSYTVETQEDGTEVYDPPLPDWIRERMSQRSEELRESLRDGSYMPRIQGTDTAFFANRGTLAEQFNGDERWLKRFDKEYRKQTGQALPHDAVYFASQADHTFDAKAVVRRSEGKAKLDQLIKRRSDRAKRAADAPPVRLAEDLVQQKMKQYRESGDSSDARELRQKVIDKHGAKI